MTGDPRSNIPRKLYGPYALQMLQGVLEQIVMLTAADNGIWPTNDRLVMEQVGQIRHISQAALDQIDL